MTIGDIVTLDPYWKSDTHVRWAPEWAYMTAGMRGVVLGFINNPERVVVHFFNDSRKYRYYSHQHVRPYRCPNYKGFNNDNR